RLFAHDGPGEGNGYATRTRFADDERFKRLRKRDLPDRTPSPDRIMIKKIRGAPSCESVPDLGCARARVKTADAPKRLGWRVVPGYPGARHLPLRPVRLADLEQVAAERERVGAYRRQVAIDGSAQFSMRCLLERAGGDVGIDAREARVGLRHVERERRLG